MPTSARRGISAIAAVLTVLAMHAATAGTAAAHAELETSDPADGSTIDLVPASVRLTFTEAVAQPAAVVVRGPDGSTVSSGDPDLAEATVTQAVGDSGPGRYTISYQVTSVDGHPIEGMVGFTVAGGSSTGPETDTEPNAAATGANAGGDAGSAADTSATASADDVSTGVVVGLMAGLALAIGLVAFGVRRLLHTDG